ncbi:Transcriptional regulator STERILE APETALA [Hibiscus syriacus]|uniref:Transcriptional regulator STERILE APETALA n=1 Tax=Hibiscus syriacus TaxID=106335 RepID=A0A6A3AKY4_HIBSY|nr:transcriptional regulator STERILE APETALA-like [Hibiscus syriacus]KAE8703935.1 Transcriptional regulator STERILE APETALA [Hibiscus syriacus]
MSSSSSEDGNGSRARRSGGDFGAPSLTRRRSNNEIWPGPFVEDLVVQVAIDASRSLGRLAAAAALANVFQVCSTWQAVSRSDPLWQRLTGVIWGRNRRMHDSWREEYTYRHRTAQNFRAGRSIYDTLHFDLSGVDNPDGLSCRCLTLSDTHLACGFADGVVRFFHLATRQHVGTFHSHPRDRFGRFSRAVSGIIVTDPRIIFATLDGDIHVAIIDGEPLARTAHLGNVVNDGALVDFTGCGRWWVGLYAGVPDRAIHVWDGNTEELVYVNTNLTDPEAVIGWHTLTEFTDTIGRVRVTSQESAVACTGLRYLVLGLRNPEFPLHDRECRTGITVTSFDTNSEAFIMVDNRGLAIVRRVDTLDEVCRFNTRQRNVNIMGCMNLGYALMCAGGVIRVWEIEQGRSLYSLNENVGGVNAMVADDTHVAAAGSDTRIHLWDFGAQ